MAENTMDLIAKILVLIGGLNWGLVGLLDMNLVTMIFGSMPSLVTAVYALVGLSALYMAYAEFAKQGPM
jgi:uncharacterized membrane protein YuzA (DUF378 family)